MYLLLLALVELLDIVDRDNSSSFVSEVGAYFPFWAVTLARVVKTLCNYITTENLLQAVLARQTQNELYFFQRVHVVKSGLCGQRRAAPVAVAVAAPAAA